MAFSTIPRPLLHNARCSLGLEKQKTQDPMQTDQETAKKNTRKHEDISGSSPLGVCTYGNDSVGPPVHGYGAAVRLERLSQLFLLRAKHFDPA